jgi:hypothetical protein
MILRRRGGVQRINQAHFALGQRGDELFEKKGVLGHLAGCGGVQQIGVFVPKQAMQLGSTPTTGSPLRT